MNALGKVIFITTFGLAAGACTTTASRPDLTVPALQVKPSGTTAGSRIAVTSTVRNAGAADTGREVEAMIDIFAKDGTDIPAILSTWRQEDGETLAAGEEINDEIAVKAPDGLAPGAYEICAVADPGDEIVEASEDNNRRCTALEIVPGPAVRADLVIEKVTPLDYDQASRKVAIKIRNAGTEAASNFRIMAFKRSPRQPLLLIECALTEGQLNAGSPASCANLTQREPLAPGASIELTGYFAFVVANGAEFLRQPVNADTRRQPVSRTIDIMVDGCFPPEDQSPVYCTIEEIDEINNFRAATFKAR